MRLPYALVLLPALVGVALGANAYFALAATTGVDGTPGALLAFVGALKVALGVLLATLPRVRGWVLAWLKGLIGLAAALTAIAAYFLMQYPFAIAMAVALVGLLMAMAVRSSPRTS